MSNTLLASVLRVLWRTIDSYQVNADALFEQAGLDPVQMNSPKSRYPVDDARRAWALAAQKIADPCFGISAGQHWFPTDIHALGFSFLSSSTLHSGLGRIVRYNEIVDEVISFSAYESDGFLILSYSNDRVDLPDIAPLEVARWSIVLTMCSKAKGMPVYPRKVELIQADQGCCAAYKDFFGCEPAFGMPHSKLYFDLNEVNQPLPAPHAYIARLNDKIIGEYLETLHHEHYLSRQVARLIRDSLPSGHLSDNAAAQALNMSTRTLQRKLAAEGTSFKQIQQDVRLSMANEYLHDEKLMLSEVSYLLGFSEQSSFTRAYKRWTGKRPSEMREEG